jgi:GGDEF domain-containing protein
MISIALSRAVRNVVLIFADADLFDHLVPADDIGLDAGHEFLRRAADRFYTALKNRSLISATFTTLSVSWFSRATIDAGVHDDASKP